MKSDDLERLEESQEMKQLIRSAKERYEQEKSAQPPVPYSVFARTLKERQKGEKMEVKQKPFGRGVLGEKHKYGKRSEISPWWLVAACLLGCIIGYGVSNTPDSRETDTDRLAVTDTVIIVHERVDTVYREVKVPSQSLVASQAAPRSKDILQAWQRKYKYILIDEFQDINQIQYEIVKMLALPENNLFIVGDDDQSIYRFRGARPELMLGFEKDYPDAERILLDVNYRCVDPVIESAGKLIANNKTRFQKEIHGNRGKGCPVFVKEWPDPLAETKAITEELRDYHQMGIAYEDMAVLYRTNQGPRLLIERMMEYNIPFHMRDTVPNLYEHWISRNVFCYIYAALGDLSRSNILQIINRPARYISRDALDTKVIRWEQLRSFYQDKNWMLDRIDQLVYDLEMLREMAPAGAVNYIRKAIGYDDYLREYANERRLKPEDLFEVLDALQESAVPFKTYEAWFNHMDEYKEQLKEQSALREAEKEGVSLMTMHSCKGLEFKVVYILDTNEGITPHHKAVLEPDLEEERRMFYVAMTRAKDRLHIFYVKERYHKRQTVSRFVVETGLLGKKGDLEKNGKQGRK